LCDEDYLEDITRSPAAYSPPPLPELSLYPDDVESEESLHEMDQGYVLDSLLLIRIGN